jgi:hypothetical protein
MPRLTNSLAITFVSRGLLLEKTRSKMETLLSAGHVALADLEQVYVGLYLDIFTEFETTIENLFLGLLTGSLYSRTYSIKRQAKIQPVSMTRQVIFMGRPYLDWLPYRDQTIPRAKNYFDDGKPFTLLTNSQELNLNDYCTIRNALAHKSDSAKIKFQKLISGLPLLPHEKSPAGYLRSRPYSTSRQTQYEIAVLELANIVKVLCS